MSRGRLLCAVADDDAAHDVIDTGRRLAEETGLQAIYTNVAEVDVTASSTVIPAAAGIAWAPFPEGGFQAAERRAAERSSEFLASLGIGDDEVRVATGSPTSALHDLAREIGAEAIVVGGVRGPLSTIAVGSVPRWFAVNGSVPLIFARPDEAPPPEGPVVCGVDPDAESAETVASFAAHFAMLLRRPVVLVHAGPFGSQDPRDLLGYDSVLDADRRAARRSVERLAQRLPDGVDREIVVESGTEADRLAATAHDRDAALLVTGNRGRGLIRSTLIGSVSLELAQTCRQIVAVVPPNAGFSSHERRR